MYDDHKLFFLAFQMKLSSENDTYIAYPTTFRHSTPNHILAYFERTMMIDGLMGGRLMDHSEIKPHIFSLSAEYV